MENNHPTYFYANAVNISASVYDVSLAFKTQSPQIDVNGNVMINQGQPVIVVEGETTIRMSPQHAKAMAALILKQVLDYEKQFNIVLPLQPELKALWEDNVKKPRD